ncbi:uncharacterized protein [Fopius arisanus]|uniref:Odorant receptor n=2 Tax=Fopius arisanus TaxID=64838 RepID=A0A9R1TIK7_9HYME|nr:PREDICTED: uncharacterized protein LOC105270562 [Fopius arisanus]
MAERILYDWRALATGEDIHSCQYLDDISYIAFDNGVPRTFYGFRAMLRTLINATKDQLAEHLYENHEEKKLYLKYNSLSKLYYKFSVPYVMTAACVYYLRPLVTSLLVGNFGTNDSMILPFRITLPYTILDTRMYWMTYAYLSPMIYLLACHNGWICVLITVQLHICGQLSIVEHRIRNIVHVTDHDTSHAIFKSLVDRHSKSIWMAKSFDDSFHFILLLDLIVMTVLLGLTSYVIIIGHGVSESSTAPVFGIAGTATLLLIYGYCIVGESLISESSKVHAAYYECMWYESSANFKKAVMICMLSSQEPLRMTAGKFFVFSLTASNSNGYFSFTIFHFLILHMSRWQWPFQEDESQLREAKQLFAWNRMVFIIIGLWPLEPTIYFFHTWLVYFAFHLSMGFVDLVLVFGDLEEVVANVSETALESMIIVKMVVMKYSDSLREAVMMARDGLMEDKFLQSKEKKIYLIYNAIAKKFFKWAVTFAFISAILYHLKPMETRFKAALANETVPMLLPYRSHLTFQLTDMTTYILIYLYQSPMIYIHTFHTAAVCFLITLVLNACGHLAILARRIRRIQPDNSTSVDHQLINSVQRYLQIVRFAKLIDKSFWIILLEELVTTTVCLGLASYNVLVNADLADTTTFMTFVMYVFTMLLLIYGYCFAGEYLITESMNVHEAYYECNWADLSFNCRKSLTLCLIGTEKPLQLRAGGFYTFSMAGFTGIMKTAMAYLSMLRTLISAPEGSGVETHNPHTHAHPIRNRDDGGG